MKDKVKAKVEVEIMMNAMHVALSAQRLL